jgi:acetoin:2,6-dichlorophenolindophenol oxidoreductase subunit alpha
MSDQKLPLPSKAILASMWRGMLTIRLFEEALFRAFMSEKMPGTMHQTNGQEAIAVGVGHVLVEGDVMTSTHRGHGHALVKGIPVEKLAAEMYARGTGTSGGLGGSMHIFDMRRNFLGTTGVVGAGVPIAVGAALALQLEKNDRLAVAFMGDGAANQGPVHEALNLAAIWKLPVLFICENNGYAVSYPTSRAFAIDRISARAEGYGMPGRTLDGNDVVEVYHAAQEAAQRARRGGGPTFLECITYRQKGHSRFEPAAYRPEGELDYWLQLDPIQRLKTILMDENLFTEAEMERITSEVRDEIRKAIQFARSSPLPTLQDVLASVYSGKSE